MAAPTRTEPGDAGRVAGARTDAPPRDPPPPADPARVPLRILISDDDPTCCQLLAALMRPWGGSDTVHTGVDTVTAFTAGHLAGRPYDLVFLDIGMPDIDGHALLCALRGVESAMVAHRRVTGPPVRHTPIVMATSRERLQDVATAFRNQCDGYLVKPVDAGRLQELLTGLGIVARA